MIVVSGVLVLVALIFLIIGLLQEGLLMIWLSIGTSVVAGVFLLLGALQRRGTPAAAGDTAGAAPETLEQVTAVSVRPREAEGDATAAMATAGTGAAADASSAGQVAVVPGRPRYHVEGCRFLAGRPDVETIAVEQARDQGFTACGVCKPDVALAAAEPAPEPEAAEESVEETTPEPVAEEPAAPARKAPAKRTRTAAATGAAAAATATVDAPAKPAKKAAAKSTAAGASQVVVIPDRGKFHVETCRFVKDVPGTVTLSKTTAKRQGYAACGVCKP